VTGIRRLPLESFPPFDDSAADLVAAASTAAEEYTDLARNHEWDLLHVHSGTLVGLADVLLRRIQTLTDLENAWADSLTKRDRWLKTAFEMLAADTSAEADELRSVMLDRLSDLTGDAEAAQATLSQLLSREGPLFVGRVSAKSRVASEQDVLAPFQIQTTTLATRAAVESSLFKAHEQVSQLETTTAMEDDIAILEGEGEELVTLHSQIVQSLFSSLRSDSEISEFGEICAGRQAQIATRVPTAAMLLGGYLALTTDDDDEDSRVRQFRAALTVAEFIRRLGLVHAYVSLARAESAKVDGGRWYSDERRRTQTRSAESRVPSGQTAEIADLSAGDVVEGLFVQLEGRVEQVAVSDDPSPPKFSTFFTLADPGSGESIRVRAHMFNLINIGLANNAFTRLSGRVRIDPSWAEDSIGVDIDRVSLTELRRESWYDDITYRLRLYSLLYPDEMNMFFTPSSSE
jgi:hypothetical protein